MADNMEDFTKMKVADLKKLCKERGLAASGSKAELVERLRAPVATEAASLDSELDFIDEHLLDSDSVLEESIDLKEKPKPEKVEVKKKPETKAPVSPPGESETKPVVAKISSSLTPAEKIKQRAERFGVVNEDMKKQLRAERFGASDASGKGASGGNVDVLKKRAERFGQVTASTLSKTEEEERIRKRKERFGEITSATNNAPKIAKISFNASAGDKDKLKKRAERFGMA
ncbi:SAP domain-containing ribonucleoprotein-like isoform X1 [Dreissena polymorpha]|uniref:SAP domain-containing ribonucleoprotein-like isoform X1 n=1 Tax=Dreissena polymorpha TaxID=45954 RepID=UPI00226447D8|nr:SAP domain-containing ribonucleoprotein-like isoform X1 [Dreissena polymorpha]XP_052224419.1 SAP domain-containing ribonucleoprotein-like isoform X1 [Dreissena polymorpha]